MPQKTKIEWTDYSSNPIYAINKETGKRGWFCTKPSTGCAHCYAETLNVGRFGNGLKYSNSNVDKVEFVQNEKELEAILRLNRSLERKGERAKLFPCDMTDVFLEHHPDKFLDKLFAVFALCPNIDFQVLTKRPERMRDYLINRIYRKEWQGRRPSRRTADERRYEQLYNRFLNIGFTLPISESQCYELMSIKWPLPNVWLGVSVEDQKTAAERIPILLETPAAVRWLSIEPLLGPIDLRFLHRPFKGYDAGYDCLGGLPEIRTIDEYTTYFGAQVKGKFDPGTKVDWCVVGGESGSKARLFNIEWARSIIRQCKATGVPVFLKQLGSKPITLSYTLEDVPLKLKNRKGGDMREWPEDLQIREFPNPNAR